MLQVSTMSVTRGDIQVCAQGGGIQGSTISAYVDSECGAGEGGRLVHPGGQEGAPRAQAAPHSSGGPRSYQVYLSIYQYIYLSIYLSIYISIYLSIYLFV